MQLPSITPNTYKDWVSSQPNTYSVLMIKKRYCGPCTEAYPRYKKLHGTFAENTGFRFAALTITEDDYDFVRKNLEVSSVPTFHVYLHSERLFATSGKSGVEHLQQFLSKLP